MILRVISNLMPIGIHPLNLTLIGIHTVSDHIKGHTAAVLFRAIHDAVSNRGIRTIIKGQCHHRCIRIDITTAAGYHSIRNLTVPLLRSLCLRSSLSVISCLLVLCCLLSFRCASMILAASSCLCIPRLILGTGRLLPPLNQLHIRCRSGRHIIRIRRKRRPYRTDRRK